MLHDNTLQCSQRSKDSVRQPFQIRQRLVQDPKPRIEFAVQVASFAESSCLSVHHFLKSSSTSGQSVHGIWKSADSLQQQLLCLIFDRLFKMKNIEKAKECLSSLGRATREKDKLLNWLPKLASTDSRFIIM